MSYTSRPPSARPKSAVNPITGMEMPYSSRQQQSSRNGDRGFASTKQHSNSKGNGKNEKGRVEMGRGDIESSSNQSRPKGVPALNFGDLGKEKRVPAQEFGPYSYRVQTPNTASTVSWGTPKSSYQKTALDMDELRLNLYEEEPDPNKISDEVDETRDQQQKAWTYKPYNKKQDLKKADLKELEEEKMKRKLLETVMIDQLSRAVISDPEQDMPSMRSASRNQGAYGRGSARSLHHSKVKTTGSVTENLLSRRIHFGARILTRNGRDAIRELMGFFFVMDNSLTIYEYRQFGKSHKAMPFIKRGRYEPLKGWRRGEAYLLTDIFPGATLQLSTANQPLPDTMLRSDMCLIRVTDFDQENWFRILSEEGLGMDRKLPHGEIKALRLQEDVQEMVQHQLKKRGVKAIRGLGKLFRKADDENDGLLNRYELEKALKEFHINIPADLFSDLWESLDMDDSCFLDYGEFMRGFIGEMAEHRKSLVRKAFIKLDSSKQGEISLSNMRKFYNAYKHPSVKSGEKEEDLVLSEFLQAFEDGVTKGMVSYTEFEEYYEGISLAIEDDTNFANIVTNAWGL